MSFLFIIVGAFLGLVFAGSKTISVWALVGGIVGYLFYKVNEQEKNLDRLFFEIDNLTKKLSSAEKTDKFEQSESFPSEAVPENQVSQKAEAVPILDVTEDVYELNTSVSESIESPSTPEIIKKEESVISDQSDSTVWFQIVDFFTSGNLIVRGGILILFFGIAFLLKYAANSGVFPIELRLCFAAFIGLGLTYWGWRIRENKRTYALVIQGGGVGILYIDTFAALNLYHLIPPEVAFFIFVGLVILLGVLALIQDTKVLAILGLIGGFLAPVLTSTGQGNHIILFSYYAVLNIGIFALAWFKPWRELNLLGFGFTFGIGIGWGLKSYTPELFSSTEPFLILFFLLYVAIPVLYSFKQNRIKTGYVDGSIIFGTPIVTISSQAYLVAGFKYGMAWSCFLLGLFYVGFARWLYVKFETNARFLIETFVALAVVLGTLTFPYLLEPHWTASVWALEGLAIIWVNVRQSRLWGRIAGIFLLINSGLIFINSEEKISSSLAIFNSHYVGIITIAIAGIASAFLLYRHESELHSWEKYFIPALWFWGICWWFVGGIAEIHKYVDRPFRGYSTFVFFSVSCAGFQYLSLFLNWKLLSYPCRVFLLAMFYFLLMVIFDRHHWHPFEHGGFFVWLLGFSAHYYFLKTNGLTTLNRFWTFQHIGALWFLVILFTLAFYRFLGDGFNVSALWKILILGAVPAMFVYFISNPLKKLNWPIDVYKKTYMTEGAMPIVIYLFIWLYGTLFFNSGNPSPLIYLPVLNPLEILQVAIFLSLIPWWKWCEKEGYLLIENTPKLMAIFIAGASLFLWVNSILLRSIHHFLGVKFEFQQMFDSLLVQSTLSVYWCLAGVAIMTFATRKSLRPIWMAGAGLLGVVVLKLFLVDLVNTGTVARIVSFMVVGALMLVVGYFSPVPPAVQEETNQQ